MNVNKRMLITYLIKYVNKLIITYLFNQWHYFLDNFAKATGPIMHDYFYTRLIIIFIF